MRKQKNTEEQAMLSLLGSRLREYRKLHNLSQEDLAYISGIDRHTISNIENGKDDACFTTLYRLMNSMNKPSDLLFLPSGDDRSGILSQILVDISNSDVEELKILHRFLKACLISIRET